MELGLAVVVSVAAGVAVAHLVLLLAVPGHAILRSPVLDVIDKLSFMIISSTK
jgi:hypothetical protein